MKKIRELTGLWVGIKVKYQRIDLKIRRKHCNIQKLVALHWLRHSYNTHLLENGTYLRYIREIPGHKSSRTKEIYSMYRYTAVRTLSEHLMNCRFHLIFP